MTAKSAGWKGLVAGLVGLFAVSPMGLAADITGMCARTATESGAALTSLDLITDPATAAFRPGQIEPVCGDRLLESLSVGLATGNELSLALSLSQLQVDHAVFHVDRLTQEGETVDWLMVSPSAGEISAGQAVGLELTVAATNDLAPESRHDLVISISLHDGMTDWSIDLPVTLQVDAEQSLFRDQFEVDPVLGQFSYRMPGKTSPSRMSRQRSSRIAGASE